MLCREYRYSFLKNDNALTVNHEDIGGCVKSEGMYGVKGKLSNVKSGDYVFVVRRYIANDTTPRQALFSKRVTVK